LNYWCCILCFSIPEYWPRRHTWPSRDHSWRYTKYLDYES